MHGAIGSFPIRNNSAALGLFGAPCSDSTPGELFPLPPLRPAPSCITITKHKIDNKTRRKHRYNTIPIFRSSFFPLNYTAVHLCFTKYIANCQGNSNILAIFFTPCMVIYSRQKRFVMNMQLRQCFVRGTLFRPKKSQILSNLF